MKSKHKLQDIIPRYNGRRGMGHSFPSQKAEIGNQGKTETEHEKCEIQQLPVWHPGLIGVMWSSRVSGNPTPTVWFVITLIATLLGWLGSFPQQTFHIVNISIFLGPQ